MSDYVLGTDASELERLGLQQEVWGAVTDRLLDALDLQTGARVLPVAHNAGLLWPRNSFLKRPGKVTVVIGEPIASAGHTPEELMREVENWIEGQVAILVRTEREENAA